MLPLLELYWPLLIVAVLIGLGVAWFLLRANRKTQVNIERSDVLDDGAAPAARNQALIDSSAKPGTGTIASELPPSTPAGLAGAGTAVAASTQQASERAQQYGAHDDLTRIKGVGPKLADRLAELGVDSFARIAAWDDAEIDRIDAELGRFQGRIRRDRWVEQARLLAADDRQAYEAAFGNG